MQHVTGNLESARQSLSALGRNLSARLAAAAPLARRSTQRSGNMRNPLAEAREAFRLNPASGMNYANLVSSYLSLNRLEEARATAEEAQAKKLDSP